ncbi:MAG: DUF378 domain-containing protein [Phycisphaerales bacterium]|nr:DUF378 domain-containing protein [Phycisphaerae bacterium]NNF41437.1 DUF378 domain-containing protein [Phycisphaerales bacterium]NNM26608.1 DUF378 domain-containing protein [Phycisphaerales bacterium]
MKMFDVIAASLLVIGGLNWGLVGLFEFDLVATLFGGASLVATIVYTLVGLSALYQVAGLPWIQQRWNVSPRLVAAG